MLTRYLDPFSIKYQNFFQFVRLGHLLRVSTTDTTDREGEVLHLIAQAALEVRIIAYIQL